MFSELVDTIVSRTNRIDFQDNIVAYLNETMRAIQNSALFSRDLVEDIVYDIAAQENVSEPVNVYVWKRPIRMRQFRAVAYEDSIGNREFPPNIPPSEVQKTHERYYYGSGDSIVFCDSNGFNKIKVAYYQNLRQLNYFAIGSRPAVFDRDTETWTYLNTDGEYVPTLNDEVVEQQARDKVSNWLLASYSGVLSHGTCTKVFSVLQDPRNVVEYSNFQSGLNDLRSIEKYEATGYNIFKG